MKFTKNEYNLYIKFGDYSFFKNPEEEYIYNSDKYKVCKKCNINKCLNNYPNNTSGKMPFNKNGFRLKRGDCFDCRHTYLFNKKICNKKYDDR